MRHLATIRKIKDLTPIDGADMIELATVDGWKVVVKRGEFTIGDLAVYVEIDSFLPESDERFAFLMRSGVRTFEGARGHVLRTIKLRGTLSQGLLLPLSTLGSTPDLITIGADVTDQLGIKKWEREIPAALAGLMKGDFPSWIRKTDQERAQNLEAEIFGDLEAEYEITTKLDGSSMTAYIKDGEVGVCSRNLELKITAENAGNTFVKVLVESGLYTALMAIGDNFAVQGEIMGPGIQDNHDKLSKHEFYVYDIFDIDSGRYLPPAMRLALYAKIFEMTQGRVKHVPIIDPGMKMQDIAPDIDGLLKFADGPSMTNKIREGLVFKRLDGDFSFKAISNEFLLLKGKN